jgi:hypothetical protein
MKMSLALYGATATRLEDSQCSDRKAAPFLWNMITFLQVDCAGQGEINENLFAGECLTKVGF